ncbi:MAG: phosphatase PAP2 family protein, partial [Clostridiaceae bacterium]|nr:phosphatase PAP2 family protein [Clostridiaceae bacterium]
LAEKHITTDYWVSYIPFDDVIPFLEGFVIFYCLWYPFMILTGLYLLIKDIPAFERYMWFIIFGFTISITICIIFPNGQDLRPLEFERVNLCTRMVEAIYKADTNTNVLPSMHVVGQLAAAIAVFDSKTLKNSFIRTITVILTILVCLSTVFIKQHSILDIFAGIAVSIIVWLIVYRTNIFKSKSLKAD